MDDESRDLAKSLQTSFIDKNVASQRELRSELIKNDVETNDKVVAHLAKELEDCDSFYFSVAFVTRGGLALLLGLLKDLDERGIPGRILVSDYLNFSEPEALRKLRSFKNLDVRVYDKGNFHTKCYVFRHGEILDIIVGSSNLTQAALTTNTEWNLKVSSDQNGEFAEAINAEFEKTWCAASELSDEWIAAYEDRYRKAEAKRLLEQFSDDINRSDETRQIVPNKMQQEALANLQKLRIDGKNKALLISATGTGKTFLSAFDVKQFGAKKVLFVVHREQIAREAALSYREVIKGNDSYTVLSGKCHDVNADFVFSTVQTLASNEFYKKFAPDYFDYIVIDEVHRAAAKSYDCLFNYFKPKFLLGMTATPERTSGQNVYSLFDYNIAYEIRLQKALESDMLCPFHYFGVAELTIDGVEIDDKIAINYLTCEARINNILRNTELYGHSGSRLKGLIFCSRKSEAIKLSSEINKRINPETGKNYRTLALSGEDTQEERRDAVRRLSVERGDDLLDYIITVDIFNEGVDIPQVNQIVMLRPTQSAIIFVQQLGRGLRKAKDKEFVIVIDFIGNYTNNFMIPIALSGDKTMNKDVLRRYVFEGRSLIPGSSTITFDRVSEKRIFDSLTKVNFSTLRLLREEYLRLKEKIGRVPTLMDFYNLGAIDPQLIISKEKSYYNFLQKMREDVDELSFEQQRTLEFISSELANGKRPHELLILEELMRSKRSLNLGYFKNLFSGNELLESSNLDGDIGSAFRVLSGEFLNEINFKRYYNLPLIKRCEDGYALSDVFRNALSDEFKLKYLDDVIGYALTVNEARFLERYRGLSLSLFKKYSRKDVCRLLNWRKDESATVYGYRVKHNTCPIFVTLNKSEDIVESVKYEDAFISRSLFSWMTRNNVRLDSREVVEIKNYKQSGLRILLFVKKENAEGSDFYFLGELEPFAFTQKTINSGSKELPVVNVKFRLLDQVRADIYDYLNR